MYFLYFSNGNSSIGIKIIKKKNGIRYRDTLSGAKGYNRQIPKNKANANGEKRKYSFSLLNFHKRKKAVITRKLRIK